MLDLETLSTARDAAILSIGAVKFCLETYTLGEEFYRVIRLDSAIDANLSVSAATIEWWMKQGEEARAIFNLPLYEPAHDFSFDQETEVRKIRVGLGTALVDFSSFVQGHGVRYHALAPADWQPCIWGNGSTFDNVILRNAYEECGMTYPVSYKNDLCYRTIRRLFPLKQEIPQEGTRHNSLDDARRQARALIETIKCIRGVDPESPYDLAEVKP